jgi:DNA-binding beta-propeller fold protein YncE
MVRQFAGICFGAFLLSLITTRAILAAPAPPPAQAPAYITQWGGDGGPAQLFTPIGVATDASGHVYVLDGPVPSSDLMELSYNRVVVFTSTGAYLSEWHIGPFYRVTFSGITVDAADNVYLTSYSWTAANPGGRVAEYTSAGVGIIGFGCCLVPPDFPPVDGMLSHPLGVATDALGDVYVADSGQIQKFTSTGTYVTKWYCPANAVAVDAAGDLYVAGYDDRIQKFTGNGASITQWGTEGTGNGQFEGPNGVAVDPSGNVYVADSPNNRIQEFTSDGTYVTQWGTSGSGNGQFHYPSGLATDAAGNVYVADHDNNRIQKFGLLPTPAKLTSWGRLKSMYR